MMFQIPISIKVTMEYWTLGAALCLLSNEVFKTPNVKGVIRRTLQALLDGVDPGSPTIEGGLYRSKVQI